MIMEQSKLFSVMVVGDNPDELMKKYDLSLEVKPYIKFKYKDADKIKNSALKVFNEMIKSREKFTLNDFQVDYLKDKVKKINGLSSFEYYQMVTEGMFYDEDGNAMSEKNPDGKWKTFCLGKNFSLPLKLVDGGESYQALNKDIDWSEMHMQNTNTYEIVWDLVHENRTPRGEEEEMLYQNMKDKTKYFENFKDKEAYVNYNCAYWNYAYLDENGWKDVDDDGNEVDWINNFFDRFVSKIKPDEKVTIYECTRTVSN